MNIFIPNPLRHFKCQKFGRGSAGYRNKASCQNCAEDAHEANCTKPPKCRNCLGDHAASSKICSIWVREKEIQKIKHTKKVSYPDARKQVEGFPALTLSKTYAAVVKPKLRATSCQTELTWVFSDKPQPIGSARRVSPQKSRNVHIQTNPIQSTVRTENPEREKNLIMQQLNNQNQIKTKNRPQK